MAESKRSSQRTDEIRHRRTVSKTVPVARSTRKARQVASQHTPPPVMARSSMAGMRGVQQDAESPHLKRVKRRYDVMLKAQGAEMRLPAFPQVRLGWRLASFLLLALLAFALYTLWNSPIYQVETAEVAGLQRLSSTAVNAVAGVSGQPVFAVDTNSVQQSLLQAFPEFSAVSVHVELPNTVVVTVTERVPVLVWRQDGRSSLVDAQGMLFPVRNETAEMPYPVVEAAGSPPSLSPAPVSSPELLGLTANLPVGLANWNTTSEAVPFLSEEMVSAILLMAEKAPEGAVLVYDTGRGLGWRDRRGWDVFFGNVLGSAASNMDVKLRVYKAILDRLKAEDVKPVLISVEYVDAPYYRLEQ